MPMYRTVGQQVIDGKKFGGVILRGERLPNVWDVSVFEVEGHRELSARQAIQWTEVAEWQDRYKLEAWPVDGIPLSDEETAERHCRTVKKAAQRAQTKCRRLIKASNFREMLTITYRENQLDRELCKVHFKEWVRRMKNALPKFQYCASFERQERGSMHVHCATNKLPRFVRYKGEKIEGWTLGTVIWREIVGGDNGLVFVGGKPRWGSSRRRNLSLARIASYVSKYIMKDYADCPVGANRYSRSNDIDLAKPERIRLEGCDLGELISVAFELPRGHEIVSHRVGRWQDTYWLCTEPGGMQ